jgi:hypothetical protein
MKRALTWIALMLALVLSGAPSYAADTPPAQVDPEVLKLREAAWRAWFAGDTEALGRMLPPEFIGISMDGPLTSRADTLAESSAFRTRGGRLTRLEFPETRQQRYGDVVVLYGRYVVAYEAGGSEKTFSGRLTELFVRQDKTWVHTGWHLDTVAVP